MMITFALRLLGGWFAFGIGLGLCWMVACVTTRWARKAFAGVRLAELAHLFAAMLLPVYGSGSAAQGELYGVGLGLALPRRFVARAVPIAVRAAPTVSRRRRQA